MFLSLQCELRGLQSLEQEVASRLEKKRIKYVREIGYKYLLRWKYLLGRPQKCYLFLIPHSPPKFSYVFFTSISMAKVSALEVLCTALPHSIPLCNSAQLTKFSTTPSMTPRMQQTCATANCFFLKVSFIDPCITEAQFHYQRSGAL